MILAIPSCIIGDWVFAAVLLILSLIAYYEFINVLAAKKFPIIIDIFVFVMSIILTYWVWFKQIADSGLINEAGHIVISDISISTLAMATTILVLFLFALMYSRFDVTDVCYLVTMALVVSLGFQSFFFLRYCPMSELSGYYDYGGQPLQSCLLFFYVVIGTFMSDIGAYCTGILFGKHPMNPRIRRKNVGRFCRRNRHFLHLLVDLCDDPRCKRHSAIEKRARHRTLVLHSDRLSGHAVCFGAGRSALFDDQAVLQ